MLRRRSRGGLPGRLNLDNALMSLSLKKVNRGSVPLESKGYQDEVILLRGKKKTPSGLMPRVHLAISLFKRWLVGTHQGAVSHKHLDCYLAEFRFRFNRYRSKSRGKLFFRLAQQAVAVDAVTITG